MLFVLVCFLLLTFEKPFPASLSPFANWLAIHPLHSEACHALPGPVIVKDSMVWGMFAPASPPLGNITLAGLYHAFCLG